MARYYMLAIQPTLFGEISLTRAWGRIGTLGQQKIDVFQTERDAVAAFLDLTRRKRQKGYRPIASRLGFDKAAGYTASEFGYPTAKGLALAERLQASCGQAARMTRHRQCLNDREAPSCH